MAIGEAGGRRTTPLATATLVIGANLPDVDAFTYAFGDRLEALAFRRGWTHGVLAMAVLPVALAGTMLAWDRLVRNRRGAKPPARFPPLLLLAFLAVLSHPLLDFLNTYGMRFLAPFSWRWYYGDALFIVDPWVWAVLLAGIALSRILARRGSPRPERPARLALAAAAFYALAMLVTGRVGRGIAEREARGRGDAVERVMVGPVPLNPLRRRVIVASHEGYRDGALAFGRRGASVTLGDLVPSGSEDPRAREAAKTRPGRQFLSWARFPVFRIESAAGSESCVLTDLRYAVPAGGWASAVVPIE